MAYDARNRRVVIADEKNYRVVVIALKDLGLQGSEGSRKRYHGAGWGIQPVSFSGQR